MHGQQFATVITNVGDPRLVSSSPLTVITWCDSLPIGIEVGALLFESGTQHLDNPDHHLSDNKTN
jgi:hypothetical protein